MNSKNFLIKNIINSIIYFSLLTNEISYFSLLTDINKFKQTTTITPVKKEGHIDMKDLSQDLDSSDINNFKKTKTRTTI